MVEGSPMAAELRDFPDRVPLRDESYRIYRLACSGPSLAAC